MKKWGLITAGIIVILMGAFYFHNKTAIAQTGSVVTVGSGEISKKVQAIGYIKPLHSNKIKSSVNGSVMEIYHNAGDYVKAGEPLVKIKPQPEPSTYATTYEEFAEAVSNEQAALKNLDRFKQALQAKIITANYTDYITANNNYESAKAKRILAQQKLSLLDQGFTTVANKKVANVIKSPIDGFILQRNVDIGDPVISLSSAQTSTTLFTMANMHDLMFEGSIDELDAAKIALHTPAVITVAADPKQKIAGALSNIALQSDQENAKSGAQTIDANLPFNVSFSVQITDLKFPEGMTLRSGYSAIADINLKTKKDVLLIPERVLHFTDDNKAYVLMSPTRKNQQPPKKFITLGISDGINAEVKEGLRVGDKILDVSPSDE